MLKRAFRLGLALVGSISCAAAQTANLDLRHDVVPALQAGGYTLVMRHAQSPQSPPTATDANPDNFARERQLDEAGRNGAIAMGKAIRELKIPIAPLLSSPAYRAMETAKLLRLGAAIATSELSDGGQSMTGISDQDRAEWLRGRVARRPLGDNNVMIITHIPNIRGAFGETMADIADGETLVYRANDKGGADLVGRIPIAEWVNMAAKK